MWETTFDMLIWGRCDATSSIKKCPGLESNQHGVLTPPGPQPGASAYSAVYTSREFKRHCKNAGIKTNDRLMLHCLRKSWACNLADNGVPPQTLLKMGGWSEIGTVQKFYLKHSDANEKMAVDVLDRLMGGNRAVAERV